MSTVEGIELPEFSELLDEAVLDDVLLVGGSSVVLLVGGSFVVLLAGGSWVVLYDGDSPLLNGPGPTGGSPLRRANTASAVTKTTAAAAVQAHGASLILCGL